jgi:hypothetical protein
MLLEWWVLSHQNAIIFRLTFSVTSHLKNVNNYGSGNFQPLFLVHMPPYSRMAGQSKLLMTLSISIYHNKLKFPFFENMDIY